MNPIVAFVVAHQPVLLLALCGLAAWALVRTVAHRDEYPPPRRR